MGSFPHGTHWLSLFVEKDAGNGVGRQNVRQSPPIGKTCYFHTTGLLKTFARF